MRLVNDTSLTLAWTTGMVPRAGLAATFVVKGTFVLAPGVLEPAAEQLPPTGDTPYEDLAGSLRYPSDFAPFKPKAELLVVGSAYAPGGRPVTLLKPRVAVGSWQKTILVTGERRLRRKWLGLGQELEEAVPFARADLSYRQAFGGPGFAKNPLGRGVAEIEDPGQGRVRPMPTLLDPRQPVLDARSAPDPVGFGPLPAEWPQRAGKRGTYDQAWLKTGWPHVPADFDWTYHLAAPHDQWFEHAFRGDETLVLEHLHPEHARLEAILPGLAPRLFVARTADDPRPLEAELALDTLWIDTDAGLVVLAWRGIVPVAHKKLKDIGALLLVAEPLAAATPGAALLERVAALAVAAPVGPEEPPNDDDPAAGLPLPDDAWAAAIEREAETLRKELDEARATIEAHRQQIERQARAAGGGVIFDTPQPVRTDEEVIAGAEALIQQVCREHPGMPAKLAQLVPLPRPKPIELPEGAGALDGLPAVPVQRTADEVLAHAAEKGSFHGADLGGLDLAGARLGGLDFREAVLAGAKLAGADLSGADLTGADLSRADLSGATLSGTILRAADLSGARLAGAVLRGADLSDVAATGADLTGADAGGVVATHATFAETSAAGSRWTGATLDAADFAAALLEDAEFEEARLPGARFDGARAARARFRRAVMTKVQAAEKTDFSGADLRQVDAADSTWEGSTLDDADLRGAVLDRALFEDASLGRAQLGGASLACARFDEAMLDGAVLVRANLFRGSLEGASLVRADLRGANLFEAELLDVRDAGAAWDGAIVARTKKDRDRR